MSDANMEQLAGEIARLQRLLSDEPHTAEFFRLADAYTRAGRFDEAILVCQRGLQFHATSLPGQIALGRALFGAGQLGEASSALARVVAENPREGEAVRLFGEVLLRRGLFTEAVARLGRAIAAGVRDQRLQALFERAVEALEDQDTQVRRAPAKRGIGNISIAGTIGGSTSSTGAPQSESAEREAGGHGAIAEGRLRTPPTQEPGDADDSAADLTPRLEFVRAPSSARPPGRDSMQPRVSAGATANAAEAEVPPSPALPDSSGGAEAPILGPRSVARDWEHQLDVLSRAGHLELESDVREPFPRDRTADLGLVAIGPDAADVSSSHRGALPPTPVDPLAPGGLEAGATEEVLLEDVLLEEQTIADAAIEDTTIGEVTLEDVKLEDLTIDDSSTMDDSAEPAAVPQAAEVARRK